jgi:hypothetical protein
MKPTCQKIRDNSEKHLLYAGSLSDCRRACDLKNKISTPMKKTIILSALLLIISACAFSQEAEFEHYRNNEIKTLLGHNRTGGAYFVFTTGYSVINDKHAVLFGGRFGWLPARSLGVGLGATGFINEYHYEPAIDKDVFLAGGYGGLYIEPVLFGKSPVHLSFPVLLGAGGISYVSKEADHNNNFIEDTEAFLLAEPAAEIELNLTKFFRLAVGATYRLPASFKTNNSVLTKASASSLKGLSYTLSLKFGKF